MRTIKLTDEEAEAVRVMCAVIDIWDIRRRLSENYGAEESDRILPIVNRAFAKIRSAERELEPQSAPGAEPLNLVRFPMEGK